MPRIARIATNYFDCCGSIIKNMEQRKFLGPRIARIATNYFDCCGGIIKNMG
jgi:hypothetical protein